MAKGLSELMVKAKMSLEDMARLVRGQTLDDPRPNKAIVASTIDDLFEHFPYHDLLLKMCLDGFNTSFVVDERSQEQKAEGRSQDNHKSAIANPDAVLRHLAKAQSSGAMMRLRDISFDRFMQDFARFPNAFPLATFTQVRASHYTALPMLPMPFGANSLFE
ncbi:hypothetical protein SPRG_16653 [Saprolegnia parasitica CBS 223.65]|uniref:Uncharacterized protein n=1 Tax=Saprolegnia parasitica (strain CBS 223.65) TaxID=695850 RepID=A0A067BUH4_SAPPC|nr:hypothetical protein SPRG_16653 [Saprolegnia parasitica CBS 223.65]KDO17941.1 hypothetical protein SPRG_16653 [Saprolegnia parasitica CBS 223.65]|eukprot:XP_012211353.1 hypothetical protein SPRG_16653 [Saprolegnia parasitica CBS 223.65]